MDVAVLGLGEAGRVYAEGLQRRGARVRGFDPQYSGQPIAIDSVASSLEQAVDGADLAISLVGATAAPLVAAAALASLPRSATFADLNTGSPALMRQLSTDATAVGVAFVDVAIMAPITRQGIGTALLASGPGASALTDQLTSFFIPIEYVGPEAGTAAGLKLLRSVFMKGLAGLVIESLTAADKAGASDWLTAQIAAELGADGEATVARLVSGTRLHAVRRIHEMHDSRAYLDSLDSPTWMTDATISWLDEVARTSADAAGEPR